LELIDRLYHRQEFIADVIGKFLSDACDDPWSLEGYARLWIECEYRGRTAARVAGKSRFHIRLSAAYFPETIFHELPLSRPIIGFDDGERSAKSPRAAAALTETEERT